MKRREFLTVGLKMLPMAGLFLVACSKKKTPTEEELKSLREGAKAYHNQIKFVSKSDPIAAALKYASSHSEVPSDLQKERNGVSFENQLCSNCVFYKAVDGKEHGECDLMKGKGMVPAEAWCFSWAPQPA